MSKKGFTLIELLIVIALLGALAVGLLASVDPFEQLKKGRDTSTRNTAAEFYNSLIRYYAQRAMFAWSVTTDAITATGQTTTLDKLTASISEIAAAGELKKDFYTLAGSGNLAKISVSWPESEKVVVCFNPESKAFRNDQNTIYNGTGATQATDVCPKATSTGCYVCFQ